VISDQRLLSLDALEIPYVTIERALDRPEHSRWVAGDTIAGTRKALDHLGATGAERIALLTLRHAWAWLAETEQSYRDWCTERGREPIVIDITGRLRADIASRSTTRSPVDWRTSTACSRPRTAAQWRP
jgi:DNA-binding LacI/PurR family transcriptional regulator